MFVYIRSAVFVIVVTQKLVLQQSKNVTAKCTETLLPPPCIQFSFGKIIVKFVASPLIDRHTAALSRLWVGTIVNMTENLLMIQGVPINMGILRKL